MKNQKDILDFFLGKFSITLCLSRVENHNAKLYYLNVVCQEMKAN